MSLSVIGMFSMKSVTLISSIQKNGFSNCMIQWRLSHRRNIIMMAHLPLLISFRPRQSGTPSERKKVNKVLDFDNLYDETDDDDLIDAAEAAFDEYLAQCAADYSEACRIRAHKRS